MTKKRVVHYINQFYAGIGGEEKADTKPFKEDGPKGPGVGLNGAIAENAEIVGTVVCGDSYFNENPEAIDEVIEMIKSFDPELVIAGPAFNAGRYGVAAGAVATAVMERLGIPAVTGMYEENPGVDMYRKVPYIVQTGNSAATMRKALPAMANVVNKIIKGEDLNPAEDGYYERHRRNFFAEERGSKRAVDMLIKKLAGEEYATEYPMPDFDNVEPGKPIADLSKAKIAIVTSGGIVPHGNPDHIESSSASKYGRYDITGVDDLKEGEYETAHGGHDPIYANEDADRVIPVDVLREKERNGEIGSLHNFFYSTVGNGTAVASAKAYAAEIAKDLQEHDVDAVILTST
ncbi:glycine/betaine/sarcosine/D-proline reductase family selenoprotein B [Facklamia languida CCUG 37842]|uniref:Glycine/betaine/sarcosine/D-proline reductase family selenoprotein B n=3 Tax=Facklamia TaxID=66831 RepID=H3NH93_9LACT|nr:glycine/betaine/sarcosine/D-proline reductase family selenoprotein B [Facklamia languida CCUG 37842]